MRIDPIEFLVTYLESLTEIPDGSVLGDLSEHVTGETAIYLEHMGGFRVVRDRMDRIDVEYAAYSMDRKEAVDLSLLVREKLEDLPDTAVGGALVLDVTEIDSPKYDPDDSSREHVYCGQVAIFYTGA
jgi:chromosome condensin MukBEF complex kleisin-like MukF subunit